MDGEQIRFWDVMIRRDDRNFLSQGMSGAQPITTQLQAMAWISGPTRFSNACKPIGNGALVRNGTELRCPGIATRGAICGKRYEKEKTTRTGYGGFER